MSKYLVKTKKEKYQNGVRDGIQNGEFGPFESRKQAEECVLRVAPMWDNVVIEFAAGKSIHGLKP